jgi:hypothetical protein
MPVCNLFPFLVASISPSVSISVEADEWQLVERQSGPTNYYSVVSEAGRSFLHSNYQPGMKTAVMGWKAPETYRASATRLRWSWRARVFPKGGDECDGSRADSVAVVYLTWKRALRYYTLKYVWSSVTPKGRVCDIKRNPFLAQETVVLETGGAVGVWLSEELDLVKEFRARFEGGSVDAEVPAFLGIGLMSDGDQTLSPSSADFGVFTVSK